MVGRTFSALLILLTLAAAGTMTVKAVQLRTASPGPDGPFTELYLAQVRGRPSGEAEVAVGGLVTWQVVVRNHEGKTKRYRLASYLDGRLDERASRELRAGGTWRLPLTYMGRKLGTYEFTVLLYQAGRVAPYCQLHWWVNVHG